MQFKHYGAIYFLFLATLFSCLPAPQLLLAFWHRLLCFLLNESSYFFYFFSYIHLIWVPNFCHYWKVFFLLLFTNVLIFPSPMDVSIFPIFLLFFLLFPVSFTSISHLLFPYLPQIISSFLACSTVVLSIFVLWWLVLT